MIKPDEKNGTPPNPSLGKRRTYWQKNKILYVMTEKLI